jgi:hypothetical protein
MSRSGLLRRVLCTGAALAVTACAAPSAVPVAPAVATETVAAIRAGDMRARIYYLASDALRGRDTPSPGLEAAAAYLVSEAQRIGLQPAGEDGTFYQRWPYPLRRLAVDRTQLIFAGPRIREALQYGRDFFVAGGSTADVEGALVWVGQDPSPPAAAATLPDRVAVVSLPGRLGPEWTRLRSRQAREAEQQGARAVIHVLDPGFNDAQIRDFAERGGQPARAFGETAVYPSFLVSYAAAQRLFRAAELSLDEAWQRALSGDVPATTLPGLTATGGAPIQVLQQADPPNVVAVLRGSDPVLAEEYVILSAHFDHVGVGRPMNGDSVYNGADDNASGTSALLEIARVMAEMPTPPRRSVAFLWVSGEEKGLLGSRWYSENPTLPLEQLVANINVDMIASDRHRDSVVVIGQDYSTLGELVSQVNTRLPELNLVAADDIWPEQRFFFRSDHFNFARQEIPAIFFFTGVHECYHRPCDTVDFVDTAKAARVANLILHTALEIANAERRPQWDPAGLAEVRALTR